MPDTRAPTTVVVYRLFGHYSFNARDGGERLLLELSPGYSVGTWVDGTRIIVGPGVNLSVEQALYHGFARILNTSS